MGRKTNGTRGAPGLTGRVARVEDKGDVVILVVETGDGERHVFFRRGVFEDLWRTRRGDVLGARVKITGRPPAQSCQFIP